MAGYTYAELMNPDAMIWAGDSVRFKTTRDKTKYGDVVLQVVKRNPKTFKVKLPNGSILTGAHGLFVKTSDEFKLTASGAEKKAHSAGIVEGAVALVAGVTNSKWNYSADQIFVVTRAAYGAETCRSVPIGGSKSDTYWTVSRSKLKLIDPTTITV